MTLVFDYASDLHENAWERAANQPTLDWRAIKTPEASVLIIAGDTSDYIGDSFNEAVKASTVYEHVIIVEGNHDCYSHDRSLKIEKIREMMISLCDDRYPNITYLHGSNELIIGDTAFIGVCGWYDWRAYEERGIDSTTAHNAWRKNSADFRFVNFGDFQTASDWAMGDAALLTDKVKELEENPDIKNIVVATHMVPRVELSEWRHDDYFWNVMTPSYINTAMSDVLKNSTKIKHWIYGHTHNRGTSIIDGVSFSNNARGYPGESPAWGIRYFKL